VTARLTAQKKMSIRAAETAQLYENRQRAALEECTFQPDLSRSSKSYGQRTSSANTSTCDAASDSVGKLEKDDISAASTVDSPQRLCNSFVPVTNAVPCTMRNAMAYLRDDVFTRLARTPEATSGADLRHELDRSACEAAMNRSRSDSFVGESSTTVQSFLQRQELFEEERQTRLAQLEVETAPSHRPEINERSLQLAERRAARLMQRVASSGDIDSRSCRKQYAEEAFNFKPRITAKARDRQPRSVDQLSTGDRKHRNDRVEKMRKEQEKREIQGATFRPEVNKYKGVVGRLRILDASDTLLERMHQRREHVALKGSQEVQRMRAKEDAEFTFAPKVRGAPKFVQGMAESYRMLRAHREKENQHEGSDVDSTSGRKPEWR